MSKNSFWAPNHDSFFCKSYFPYINGILKAMSILGLISGSIRIEDESIYYAIGLAIIMVFVNAYIINMRVSYTEFFEWDVLERKKKLNYLFNLFLLCSLFSSLFVISLFQLYTMIIYFGDNFVYYFFPFCSFVWLLNLIKCVELYYNNIFKEYLELPGYLQKKPDNWKNETTKLNDDEKLSRYFYNEFGVK